MLHRIRDTRFNSHEERRSHGLAFDRALFYGKAGIAEGRFAFSEADIHGAFASGASTLTGVLLGVGLEYGFAPNWSAKLEYVCDNSSGNKPKSVAVSSLEQSRLNAWYAPR